MNPDIKTLNKMAGGIIHQIENDYPALDDAQKQCILSIASESYRIKVQRDMVLASAATILRR